MLSASSLCLQSRSDYLCACFWWTSFHKFHSSFDYLVPFHCHKPVMSFFNKAFKPKRSKWLVFNVYIPNPPLSNVSSKERSVSAYQARPPVFSLIHVSLPVLLTTVDDLSRTLTPGWYVTNMCDLFFLLASSEQHTEMASFRYPQIGKPAPNFSGTAVVNGQFKEVNLNDYKGQYLVLFFYPMDL